MAIIMKANPIAVVQVLINRVFIKVLTAQAAFIAVKSRLQVFDQVSRLKNFPIIGTVNFVTIKPQLLF
jgi:hypothetical protein